MDEVSSHVCLVLPSTDGKAARKIVPPRLRIPYWKGPWFRFRREARATVSMSLTGDPKRPIREEADIALCNRHVSKVPEADIASDLGLSSRQAARSLFTIQ